MASKRKFWNAIKIAKSLLDRNQQFINEFDETQSIQRLIVIKGQIEEANDKAKEFVYEIDLGDEEITAIEEIYDRFAITFGEINSLIDNYSPHSPARSLSDSSQASIPNVGFKLPDISLPTFAGNAVNWPTYRDLFKSLIISNPVIPDINKFIYLNTSLKGEAKLVICNLEVSAENFSVAWKLLNERFNDPRQIVKEHLAKILNPPALTPNSAKSLRQFIDYFVSHINALLALEKEVKLQDLLLVALISKYVPNELLREWELHLGDEKLPKYDEFISFLTKQQRALVSLGEPAVSSKPDSVPKAESSGKSNNKHQVCYICKEAHLFIKCPKFSQMTPRQRSDLIRTKNHCVKCLKFKSANHSCDVVCTQCNREHNSLLHFTKSQIEQPTAINDPNSVKATISATSAPLGKSTLLPTAVIGCTTKKGKTYLVNALLDSGSEISLITHFTARRLGFPRKKCSTLISSAINGEFVATETITVTIRSLCSDWHKEVTFVIVPTLFNVVNEAFSIHDWGIPHDVTLADPAFYMPKNIDVLLGADIMFEVLSESFYSPANKAYPFLKETSLGWIVAGPLPGNTMPTTPRVCNYTRTKFDLPTQLQRFWEIESCASSNIALDEDVSESKFCISHYDEHVSRDNTGRYCVKLPVLPNAPVLGNSRWQAERRLFSLEKRLGSNPQLSADYHQFMSEYQELGHMTKVLPDTKGDRVFIPHHPVFKQDSSTTKTRVVFDASARTSTGIALNDILATGPVVQDDLFTILLRFRFHPVAMVADIEKMYRQVKVHESDQHFQHILWRDKPSESIEEWALSTVTYGTAPASFLATNTLVRLAADEGVNYPLGSATITSDFYVDDLIKSCNDDSQAIAIYSQLSELLQLGGFVIRKWSTNSAKLRNFIPMEFREMKPIVQFDDPLSEHVKTLGLLWQPEPDKFKIAFPPNLVEVSTNCSFTKRKFLSCICSIYDPLGILSPSVILCKMLFQELWKFPLNWDDPLPTSIFSKWKDICRSLPAISALSIPRLAIPMSCSIQIHGFCDSSLLAYGACIYLRCIDAFDNVQSRLLCAKSRVAPRSQVKLATGEQSITIPRLELCAALLLAELLQRVRSSADLMQSATVNLWTDSSVVLAWLKAPPVKGNVFVRNRATKILNFTRKCMWRHVPSASNPADLISRGMLPSELAIKQLWWHGPEFLTRRETDWPKGFEFRVPEPQLVCKIAVQNSLESDICCKFSSCVKLFHVMAYVLRFIALCRTTCHCVDRVSCSCRHHLRGCLTVNELSNARNACCKLIQSVSFPTELAALRAGNDLPSGSKLSSLSPFIHTDGLMRVLGRLQESNLPFDSKHPVILPANHPFTKSLIMWTHTKLLHAGPSMIISDIRRNYWVISLRRLVKGIIRTCLRCFKQSPKILQQLMGNLPAERVQPSPPFTNTGVDYTGYFNLRIGGPRSKTIVKAYVALFICMSTKATHLEVVTALTAEAFIAAFNRFISRRGIPAKMFSDNATNFKRASHELNTLFHLFNSASFQTEIQEKVLLKGIEWHWIPPRSPHCGGLWEANIKSLKYHLKRIMGDISYSYEEFATITTQVEAILNSRPLFKMTDDPSDFDVLTPGHFLTGRPLVALPYSSVDEMPCNRLSKWLEMQRRVAMLWKKWSRDYLHTLQQRQKWTSQSKNVVVNTPVLLIDDNMPTSQWKLGIIIEVYPSRDGRVRSVNVRTASGTYRRHIQRVCPLPINNSNCN